MVIGPAQVGHPLQQVPDAADASDSAQTDCVMPQARSTAIHDPPLMQQPADSFATYLGNGSGTEQVVPHRHPLLADALHPFAQMSSSMAAVAQPSTRTWVAPPDTAFNGSNTSPPSMVMVPAHISHPGQQAPGASGSPGLHHLSPGNNQHGSLRPAAGAMPQPWTPAQQLAAYASGSYPNHQGILSPLLEDVVKAQEKKTRTQVLVKKMTETSFIFLSQVPANSDGTVMGTELKDFPFPSLNSFKDLVKKVKSERGLAQEQAYKNVFVDNLSPERLSRKELIKMGSKYGRVNHVYIPKHKVGGSPAGGAFLYFESPKIAKGFLEEMDGKEMDGKILSVTAKATKQKMKRLDELGCKLVVRNVCKELDIKGLKDIFGLYGTLVSIDMKKNGRKQAFVRLSNCVETEVALRILDGLQFTFMSSPIHVRKCTPRGQCRSALSNVVISSEQNARNYVPVSGPTVDTNNVGMPHIHYPQLDIPRVLGQNHSFPDQHVLAHSLPEYTHHYDSMDTDLNLSSHGQAFPEDRKPNFEFFAPRTDCNRALACFYELCKLGRAGSEEQKRLLGARLQPKVRSILGDLQLPNFTFHTSDIARMITYKLVQCEWNEGTELFIEDRMEGIFELEEDPKELKERVKVVMGQFLEGNHAGGAGPLGA